MLQDDDTQSPGSGAAFDPDRALGYVPREYSSQSKNAPDGSNPYYSLCISTRTLSQLKWSTANSYRNWFLSCMHAGIVRIAFAHMLVENALPAGSMPFGVSSGCALRQLRHSCLTQRTHMAISWAHQICLTIVTLCCSLAKQK